MGKLSQFHITFNDSPNGNAVYYAGQTISGSVVAVLSEPMEMKALKVKFQGKANVSWTETHSTGKSTYTVRYHAKETYFEDSVSVYGKGSGGSTENSTRLLSGQNTFPFVFQLPANLPSSFEGAHGHVRYSVKASIEKPWKFDHNTKVVFTILELMDLNLQDQAKMSASRTGSKTLCCWCCASAPIEAQVHLDRSGYVPGEIMFVNANVENNRAIYELVHIRMKTSELDDIPYNKSSTEMSATQAILLQRTTFHASSPFSKSKRAESKVVVVDGPGCKSRNTVDWKNTQLQIPPLPPSFLQYCNIIDIEYFIQFVVVMPKLIRNLRVKAPILIGAIPLQNLTQFSLPDPPTGFSQPMPSVPAPTTPLPLPPPSYASATGDPVNIKDDDDNKYLMGQGSYLPQYTYYDWNQTAFSYNNSAADM